jgi:signal peptidase I
MNLRLTKFFTKKNSSNSEPKKPETWGDFVKTLIFAIICATIVRSFLYEPFHIPSSSMKSNLLIGDYIFVSKSSYGYSKYSLPFAPNLFGGRIFYSKPQRGDVVVFRLPSNPSINYIKRLIGLPGDKIQVIDGQVFINEQEVSKEYVDNFIDEDGTSIKRFSETLSSGKTFQVLDQYQSSPQDNTGIYLVPEGHYFMMGDNRDNSQDSRFLNAVGYVPEENLVGRARVIFFSNEKPFWQFWGWYKDIRWQRLLKIIN